MAFSDDTERGDFTQTNDPRPAPGAMNAALGRSGSDLASNSPPDAGPDAILGAESDLFTGDDTPEETAGFPRKKKRNPDLSPDERLGLRPAIKRDAAPNTPVNPDLYGA